MSVLARPLFLLAFLGCDGGSKVPDDTVPDLDPVTGETYRDPPELEPDADGVHQLSFGPSEVEIGGYRYCMRAYDGSVPGPTIRVPAGTERRVRVDLRNEFTRADGRLISGQEGYAEEHCYDFNLTNLHFHGGHVRPDYAVGGEPCAGVGCGVNPADGDGLADDYYGDNVLIEVPQGTTAKYRWDIDEDHVHDAGLNWYHPHIHGSTGIQLASGAAGALIVEGDFDALPAIAGAKERVMVVNHVPWDVTDTNSEGTPLVQPLADGEACTEETLSVNNFLGVTKASHLLLNGQVEPVMATPPGQVERWRMVHAGGTDEMFLALYPGNDDACGSFDVSSPIPLTQVAADGIALPERFERDYLFMSPGYRIELLVPMPAEESTLCFVAARPTDVTVNEDGSPLFPDIGNLVHSVRVTAEAGEPTMTAIAADLDAQLASVSPPTSWTGTVEGEEGVSVSCDDLESGPLATPQQDVVLLHPGVDPGVPRTEPSTGGACELDDGGHGHGGDEADPCVCPEPNINCRNYGQRHGFESEDGRTYRSDRVMTAGESERWALQAGDGHPYHIHVNPFVKCPSATTKEPPFPHWRDTLWVQVDDIVANGFEPVSLLTRYPAAFTGAYVFHCHKLNHEDEGMMEKVEVCAPGDTDCLCLSGETEGDGECVEPASGCFPDDTACLYAAWVMEGFSPADLGEPPELPWEMGAEGRNSLVDAGLEECCGGFPEFDDELDLIDFLEALEGLDPACCPDIGLPYPPGHPCEE